MDAIASLIDEDSEFVFDALDGKLDPPPAPSSPTPELTATTDTADRAVSKRRNSAINYREEPVAFFFVLFGLTFEALAQRPSSSLPSNPARTLEMLLALKKILRPSVSGNAIYQEVVFAETMDLLDRMVLTSPLDMQTVIVEIARNLCIGHPSSRHGTAEEESENLSDDIDQLFELTRIIVLVLVGIVPGLGEANRTNPSGLLTDESASLAVLSLDALVVASSVFPSIIKSDLHACIFHIFTLILSSPLCQPVLVPQALPIFRRFVLDIAAQGFKDESRQQVIGTLSRFLVVVKHAQRREIEHALLAEKNSLLAGTMLITSAYAALSLPRSASSTTTGDHVLKSFLEELSDCLENVSTTKMAAGCVRTLLLMPTPAPFIAVNLLPRIIAFVTTPSDLDGLPESRVLLSSTLTSYALSSSAKPAMFSLAMPGLLTRAQREGKSVYRETAQRLLELAAGDAGTFRAIVGRMDSEIKAFLGVVLQTAQGAGAEKETDDGDEGRAPAIELKMNF